MLGRPEKTVRLMEMLKASVLFELKLLVKDPHLL